MHSLKKTSTLSIALTFIFFIFAVIRPASGNQNSLVVVSAAAALIFGVFVVFSISNSHERINKVNELLKIEDANNLSLYKISSIFDKKVQEDIKKMMDQYLIDQIDYKLVDFHRSRHSFDKIYKYILRLECKGLNQEECYKLMLQILNESAENRTLIETLTSHKLSKAEWISVTGLTLVIVALLYELTDTDLFHTLILSVLASSSILLVFILRDLDNLKWQKDLWTWKPLHRLFKELDLIPYYPKHIVDIGEAKIQKGEVVRLASYPSPYPDMKDKIIDTVTIA
jgi:hypothetical protein